MKHQTQKTANMNPGEIKVMLTRNEVTQAAIARAVGVTPTLVCDCIHGFATSRRVQQAIAEAIGKDIKEVWPETYLYRDSRPGRPKSAWVRAEG